MTRPRVLVTLEMDPSDVERLRAMPVDVDYIPYPVEIGALKTFQTGTREAMAKWSGWFPQTLWPALAEANVIFSLMLPIETLEKAPRLRWIANMGSGTEQYQPLGVLRSPVMLTSSKGVAGRSIAEFVIAQMLTLFKRIPQRLAHQREHRWARVSHRDVLGRTIGVVGLGEIGSEVARFAKGLGMRVLATRRHATGSAPNVDKLYPISALHEMLAQCDAVAVTVAYTPETAGLINRAAFAVLPKGAVLMDVSRGGVTDEAALIEALKNGPLDAAALDVFATEPLPAASPLWDLPNLLISSHNAVGIDNYLHAAFLRFVENLERFLRGERPTGIVDPKLGY